MSDLISRSALIKNLAREYATGRKTLGQVIDEQPTIEADPVVHGEWVPHMVVNYACSECGKDGHKTNFCPNCGADMRGDQNE